MRAKSSVRKYTLRMAAIMVLMRWRTPKPQRKLLGLVRAESPWVCALASSLARAERCFASWSLHASVHLARTSRSPSRRQCEQEPSALRMQRKPAQMHSRQSSSIAATRASSALAISASEGEPISYVVFAFTTTPALRVEM